MTLTPEQREALEAVVAQEDARFTPDPMDTAIFIAGLRYAYEDAAKAILEQRCERGTPWDYACLELSDVVKGRIPKDSA